VRRGRPRWLMVLALAAVVVAAIDTLASFNWNRITRTMAVNPEAGAFRLASSWVVNLPPFVERSRRMAARDLGMASREAVVEALTRLGGLQVGWMPVDPVGFTNRARDLLLRDRPREGLLMLDDALRRNPTSPSLHRLYGLVLLSLGDHRGGLVELATAEALSPGLSSPQVELAPEDYRWVRLEGLRLRRDFYPRRPTETAIALARELRVDGDRAAARNVLSEFASHPEVKIELARWAIDDGIPEHALDLLAQITSRTAFPRPLRARAWAMTAVALDHEGDIGGALEAAHSALRLDPRSSAPYVTLAGLAQRRGDPTAALAHLRRAWGMDPTDTGLLLRIAAVAEEADKPADALLALGRAVEIDSESPDLVARLVSLQLRTGRFTEAALTLSRALDRFPTDPQLLRLAEKLRRDVGIR
jgi:tetratricopeptide (TPR) repeat protein